MAFSEICRICLSVNVSMLVLKKTALQNMYKTLTNNFKDEDEDPKIVCFTCHARLIRCRRLQQQAVESNAVLEQLLAGGSMSILKPQEARDEIRFTSIYHIDISPVECDIENDCTNEIFSLESVKVEDENYENESSKFEGNWNHETETDEKAEDLEIDDFGEVGSKCKEKYKTVKRQEERRNDEKSDDDIEQYIPTNNFSKPSDRKVKSNSTVCNTYDVRKGNLDLKCPTVKSKPKVKKYNQPINKKGNHPAKIMKKKLKQKSANILSQKTSETSTDYFFHCDGCSKKFSTKDILDKHISYSHKTQGNSDSTTVRTQVEQTPVPQLTEIFYCDKCEFQTSIKRYILAHFKMHVAKHVYCCNYCDYKCIRKCGLQIHMKTHTGEKPFSCNICEYRCIRKTQLQDHLKIHTGEKPFSCNICEYKCTQKSSLLNHIKIHTGEKPFLCNICEYRCITRNSLNSHMKIHTREKSFSCHICEYRCSSERNLQTHIKIHT